MKILDNLKRVHTAVVLDTYNGGKLQLGDRIKNLALKAMKNGIDTPEWREYMSLFADNPEQLEHLSVEQETDPGYLRQFRGYIIGNSLCDAATDTKTGNRITEDIDLNVPAYVDPNMPAKPIVIPPLPVYP